MNLKELQQDLLSRFLAYPGVAPLLSEPVRIVPDSDPEVTLLPEGEPPSLVNKPEYRVTAFFRDQKGEAYTEHPESFDGTLSDVLALPCSEDGIDARLIAAINAVMCYLKACPGSFSDDPAEHARYADAICRHITQNYGTSHIVLIGYDGYLVKRFVDENLDFWTLDRDPNHITKNRFNHVIVNSGKYNRESCFVWGKIFLVTGSTLCNGTILQYLNSGKELLFYGITCSGAASLLGLPWFDTRMQD